MRLWFSCVGALTVRATLRRVPTLNRWADVEDRLIDEKPDFGACRVAGRWIGLSDAERDALTLSPVLRVDANEPLSPVEARTVSTDELQQLRRKGLTYAEIGARVGMKHETVRSRLRKAVRDAS